MQRGSRRREVVKSSRVDHRFLSRMSAGFCRGLVPVSAIALCLLCGVGCSNRRIEPETRYVAIEQKARIPAGVVRYCWEEPMVQLEPNGPGLDETQEWYHPSYLAVREAREGRWRPCKQVPSEVKGETRNER